MKVQKMTRRDVRSLILCLALGDGCLSLDARRSGRLTLMHAKDQADWISWKANLCSSLLQRPINLRPCRNGTAIQFAANSRRFKAWRKFCYPGGKKSRWEILRFIEHHKLGAAIWFADDGSVQKKDGMLRMHCNTESIEQSQHISDWFKKHFDVSPKVKLQLKRSANKHYPYLAFSVADSVKMWGEMRSFLWQFQSMRDKFAAMEKKYLRKISQAPNTALKAVMI